MIISFYKRNGLAGIFSVLFFILIVWLLYRGFTGLEYRWRWERIPRYFIKTVADEWQVGILLQGLWVTLKLSFWASIVAFALGAVIAMGRFSSQRILRGLAFSYTQVIRCTPLLVQLYLLYFMLSGILGLGDRFLVGVVALAVFESAFAAEILRSGILSIPQSQFDASHSIGLSRVQRWRFIMIPQILPLVLPSLANLFVSLIKHSSIVTIIAVSDLTDSARNLIADTFLTFELWLVVGAMYVVICYPLAWLIGRWEQSLRRYL